jgi:hypothetical protein
VLATPVGGIPEGFEEGRSGWLAQDASDDAIRQAVAELATRREAILALVAAGAPRAALEAATDNQAVVDGYLRLAAQGTPRDGKASDAVTKPAVTVVVSVFAGDVDLQGTLASLEAQQWPQLEVIVATDDPRRIPAGLLGRISAIAFVDPGGDARAAALAERRLRGHVLLVSAGDLLEAGFLMRAAAALATPAAPAYVTSYGTGVAPENAPLGNAVADLVFEYDVAASVTLMRGDAQDGFGAVIPERLAYRARRGRPSRAA